MTLEELKRIADAATQKEWTWSRTGMAPDSMASLSIVGSHNRTPYVSHANAIYCCTFNPTLIKAMLREISAARAMRDSFNRYYVWDDLCSVPDVGFLSDAYDKAREESRLV
jgi:amino acid transporter